MKSLLYLSLLKSEGNCAESVPDSGICSDHDLPDLSLRRTGDHGFRRILR